MRILHLRRQRQFLRHPVTRPLANPLAMSLPPLSSQSARPLRGHIFLTDLLCYNNSNEKMGIFQGKKDENKIIVIVGPTAVGRAALAIKWAKRFNGEVVSGG